MVRFVGWHIPHDPIYLQALVCLARSNVQVLEVGAGLGFLAAVARALGVTWVATDAMNGWGSTEESKRWISKMHHQTASKAVQTWVPPEATTKSPFVLAAAWFPPDTPCVDELKTAATDWLARFPTQGVVLLIGDPTPRKNNYRTTVKTLIPELQGSEGIKQCLRIARDTTADPAVCKFFRERKSTHTVTVQAPYPCLSLRAFPQDQRLALELTGGLVGDLYTFLHSPRYDSELFLGPILPQSPLCNLPSSYKYRFIEPIIANLLTVPVMIPIPLCRIIVDYAF